MLTIRWSKCILITILSRRVGFFLTPGNKLLKVRFSFILRGVNIRVIYAPPALLVVLVLVSGSSLCSNTVKITLAVL